ncbi:thiolase family protein [Paraburkholderia caballeronis]|uniref:Acetyl-CoA acetyltransferase n=1 Tax=Paraburkholderia caballeronis TaxID=416943 RepID=A0A1H7H8Z1_9BURK|nr:thiolase family protein [Paraburkholderia caballeronis]PXW29618.1 acetyl-CoA acetyltransferase [Paraburkholderia caballeronis]PXX04877.1 acetyl-CoA acetyltransferase [Paraburkholderia caballeronis]RAK05938.1 acetyl-CoA acetyltransferase [Paraburkholderia caballeronis]TDV11110.1 acetyl-CoA acetyltransferase [Paraburkholderia caballeronis]TDV14200.1 acetyl-CoA acetyltransferase [Paraburkholderia caballeronis]
MNPMQGLSNRIAVVGVGNTPYGDFPAVSDYALGAHAFKLAIDDCGLDKNEIDGLLCCRVPFYARMGEILGLNPRWTMTLPGHGRMSGIAITEAMLALETGAAKYVALVYTNIGRSRRMNYGGDESASFWDPWGLTSPGASHALMFRMHMERYGTTTRQLAEVSVAFRNNAILNPDAVMRKPITIDDHESIRRIVEPLGLLDYCLINDGAVCLILTTRERAADLKKPPVLISGVGSRDAFERSAIGNFDSEFWYDEIREAGSQAYEMAGVTKDDVDALMCYDNFSPTVLFSLEGLGFCGRGEAGSFVENGALGVHGRLPTNTDGGHLSNSYMQGWALNVEAIRQLRGECGERQVKDCDVVQYIAATPCTRSIIYTKG